MTSDYSFHDRLVLDVPSRLAQAEKIGRVLAHFAGASGLTLAHACCLDVGCSSGIVTHALASRFSRMVGVDIDWSALAQSRSASDQPRAVFATATGRALPFDEGTFDMVVCNQVYQYVPDVPALLAEIRRVLRPGGGCYFSARNLWGISAPENRLPFIASLSPRAANWLSRTGAPNWRQRSGTLWPYVRLRAVAARHFTVHDYTVTALRDPSLSDLFVPERYRRMLTSMPLPVLALVKPVLPTHIWVLERP